MGLRSFLSHPLVVAGLQSGALFTTQMQKDKDEEEKRNREMALKTFEYQQENLDRDQTRIDEQVDQATKLHLNVLQNALASEKPEDMIQARAALKQVTPEIAATYQPAVDAKEQAVLKAQKDTLDRQQAATDATDKEQIRNAYKSIVAQKGPSSVTYKVALDDLEGRLRTHSQFKEEFQAEIDQLKNYVQDAQTREAAERGVVAAVGSGSVPALERAVKQYGSLVSPETHTKVNDKLADWKRNPLKAEEDKLTAPEKIWQDLMVHKSKQEIEAAFDPPREDLPPTLGLTQVGGGGSAAADSSIVQTMRALGSPPPPAAPAVVPAVEPPSPPPTGIYTDAKTGLFGYNGPGAGGPAPEVGAKDVAMGRMLGGAVQPAIAGDDPAPPPPTAVPRNTTGLGPDDISVIERFAQQMGLDPNDPEQFNQARAEADRREAARRAIRR